MQLYYFMNETTPPEFAKDTIIKDGAMICGLSNEAKRKMGAKEWDNKYPTVDEGYYVEPIGYENGDIIKTLWSEPIKIENNIE